MYETTHKIPQYHPNHEAIKNSMKVTDTPTALSTLGIGKGFSNVRHDTRLMQVTDTPTALSTLGIGKGFLNVRHDTRLMQT
jgi:hypothetical protein